MQLENDECILSYRADSADSGFTPFDSVYKPSDVVNQVVSTTPPLSALAYEFKRGRYREKGSFSLGLAGIQREIHTNQANDQIIAMPALLFINASILGAYNDVLLAEWLGKVELNGKRQQIVDILKDKSDLQLKREAEAEVVREGNKLVIRAFYPMNLLQKLSMQKESVEEWRQLVESVMIDWNFDGVVMQPAVTDIPGKNEMVQGVYDIPKNAGTIKVKITDLLSESLEMEV